MLPSVPPGYIRNQVHGSVTLSSILPCLLRLLNGSQPLLSPIWSLPKPSVRARSLACRSKGEMPASTSAVSSETIQYPLMIPRATFLWPATMNLQKIFLQSTFFHTGAIYSMVELPHYSLASACSKLVLQHSA